MSFRIEINGTTVDQAHLNEVIAVAAQMAKEIAAHSDPPSAIISGQDHAGTAFHVDLLGAPPSPEEVAPEPAPESAPHDH